MNIETIPLSEINPAEYNPRIITKAEFDGLKTSLQTFGQQENLIVNKDMTLISGHQRLQAMLALGWNEAVCNVVDLDKHEEKKLNVIMNSQAIAGKFDELKLAEILEELKLDDNYESLRLNELEPLDLSPTEVEEDEPPEVSSEPPVSKLGEIYQLGRHRVMCGDSTDKASVELLMNGVKADMVFTDPPYSSGGSQESGKTSGSIGARGKKTIKSDNLSTRGYRLLMDDTLKLVGTSHSVFIFCDWKMWIETFDISERAGYRVRNMIVWDKVQMGMGMPFRNQHELCLFGSKIAGKIGDGKTPNVLQYTRDREANHATPKPVGLICDLLKQVESNYVYDPFLGSGSTLIACEQTDRTCYGMELDPKYVDVIRKRYWKFVNGSEEGWEDGTTNSND